MGEALEGMEVEFTRLFTAGLVVLTFGVAGLVAAVVQRWASLRAAVGIGVVAGAWAGFMSAGEILKNFDSPGEQLCPFLALGLVTCAARVLHPWPRARRAGFWVAAAVMAVQAVLMVADLSALAAGRLTRPGQEYPLRQPRSGEWSVLAAPIPLVLTGLVVLAGGLGYRDRDRGGRLNRPRGQPT